ncbi:MAG: GHMP family kinase ATP-binding protein [Steroidobacteraceae bacterium]
MAPRLMHSAAGPPPAPEGFVVGRAGRHHGEILQGLWWPRRTAAVDPVPCLLTLPVSEAGSEAHFKPAPGAPICVDPPGKVKAARAARLALDALGAGSCGGILRLYGSIPIGLGLGSSTSDVLATLRAVCAAYGAPTDADMLARLAVRAEVASDPLMFDGAVLFAQRHGQVLEHWGEWLPEFLLLSVDTDPQAGGRDTLRVPCPGRAATRADYTELLRWARAAFRARDAAAVAAVATRSADLNQRIAPTRGYRALRAVSAASGALGLQIAHSGTVAGVLFDPHSTTETLRPLIAQLGALGMTVLALLRTGSGSCHGVAGH